MSRWIFEPGHTAATFRAVHMMVTWVRGQFKDVHGTLEWDPERPLDTTFEGTMRLDRMSTGEPTRDEHLRTADFFDAENFPEITFRGRITELIGETHYRGVAELTIRGTTDEVPIDVRYLGEAVTPYWDGDVNRGTMRRVGFEVGADLNRDDFGVSWNDQIERGGVVVSSRVPIVIDVEAILEDDMRAVGLIE
jgi:polyisoprenoid-binding protein YceI